MIQKILVQMVIFMVLSVTAVYAAENKDINHNTVFVNSDYYSNCYIIKTDGSLYMVPYIRYDDEHESELSLNDMIPTKILGNVISVSSNCILKEDGSVWEWDDESDDLSMVTNNAKSISAYSAKLIVKNDNSLWGKGENGVGQLAQGEMDKSLKQQIEDDLKWRNKVKCYPQYYDEPVKIMDNVKSAVTDRDVSVILKNDGTVWTFGGDHGGGTLGIGGKWLVNNEPTQILSGMKEVFTKGDAGFALDRDNTLWRWGSNYTDYAGGNPSDQLTPIKYIENVKYATNMPGYNLIIKTDNSLWIYGDTSADSGRIGYISSKMPVKLADEVSYVTGLNQLDVGDDRILVLKQNGDLILLAIPIYEDKEPYEIGKVMSNVRLPDAMPVNINFTDIDARSDKEQEAITALSRAGIVRGISEREFAPDKAFTRAEVATVLLRMASIAEESDNGGFSDVANDAWYYSVAGLSKKHGIVNGFEDNTFRGDESISKVQLIALAARTLKTNRDYEYTIDSELPVPDWAKDSVSLAVSAGLVDKEKSFDGDITRGEAAVILYRLYGLI